MASVMIVEDDRGIRDALRAAFELEGFQVIAVGDGRKALDALNPPPDLIILDIMLPGLSGFEVCREVRRHSQTPIIVLSAKTAEMDKVVGLELGADDYVTKPFSVRELLLRAKAVMRRMQTDLNNESTLSLGNINVDLRRREVWKDCGPIDLTRLEFDLLAFLAQHRGQVFSRDRLMNSVWHEDESYTSRTVDVHIRRLREKLEANPSEPVLILTVRGIGYKMAAG